MRTSDFDFELPPELIAQIPAVERDQSRLLVLHRETGELAHRGFKDIAHYFHPGDVLVLNNSRVIPARLHGSNESTGGKFEILLLEEVRENQWWTMMRPGRRARKGTRILLPGTSTFDQQWQATVLDTNTEGHRLLRFEGPSNILDALSALGEVPLPPYIERSAGILPHDQDRYQTVYARTPGSVAAPTAGLHFTQPLLDRLRQAGVQLAFITLHVGFGTFAPVKSESIQAHQMHEEPFTLSPQAADVINAAKQAGRKVFVVGTTCVRVLETVAAQFPDRLQAMHGRTRIFIYPPYPFRTVDALITNFHLPRSTLLMLVSAFAHTPSKDGRKLVLATYAEAVRTGYRFFSYGDAMLVL